MGPVHAVAGSYDDFIADDQRAAVRDVVREDAQLLAHVVLPENVGVVRPEGRGGLALLRQVLRFAVEALVAVALALHVEAHHLAPVRDDVDAVADHGGRGTQPEKLPVADLPRSELRDRELPVQLSGFLVEAHQNRTVAFDSFIAGRLVVRAEKDSPAGDGRVSVRLRPELGDPLDVFRRRRVDLLGAALVSPRVPGRREARLGGDHVTAGAAAPERPVRRRGNQSARAENRGESKNRDEFHNFYRPSS